MAYDLPIIVPTAPEGFCSQLSGPDWVQILFNEMLGRAVARLEGTGFTVVLNQETQPGPDQIANLWYQPSTSGRGIYSYVDGAWIIPHPSAPGGNERRWWEGALGAAGLDVYDGGSIGAVGSNSGPMWEEDTNFQGRSPMHPGNIPTANPATVLAVGANAGEGAHTQTGQEVGPHVHPLACQASITNGGAIDVVNTGVGSDGLQIGLTGPLTTPLSVVTNEYTTAQEPMPVIHPVRGLYCIKRTARVNYVGS